jgi:hypothetical protein
MASMFTTSGAGAARRAGCRPAASSARVGGVIYALVKRGRLHPMPGSGKLLFTREALDRYLNSKLRR